MNEITVALDIGTTKICALAGRLNEYGRLEVLGFGRVDSTGVMRGVVSNIEKTVLAIKEAVAIAERNLGTKIENVNVGIAGQHIDNLQHRGLITRNHRQDEITQEDLNHLKDEMYKLVLPAGDEIIHVIPQEYTVDNEEGIVDPIGMNGVRLQANFHIITGHTTAMGNIYRCVEKAGLKVAQLTLEPIASAAAVLSKEEKEAGVMLMDIGGGTTDISIFKDGLLRHTKVFPFGGNIITSDIKKGCQIMPGQAETIKINFGIALKESADEYKIISIPGLRGREPKEIREDKLARIINARVKEIIDHVVYELGVSGYADELIGGIVVTGGGALLRDIDKLIEKETGMVCRVGIPTEYLAQRSIQNFNSPIYSTGVGLLLQYIELENARAANSTEKEEEISAMELNEDVLAQEKVEEEAPEPLEEVSLEQEAEGNVRNKFYNRIKTWFEIDPNSEM